MPCEMCGEDAPLAKVLVERSTLLLCPKCSKFGKVLELPKPKEKRAPASAASAFARPARAAAPARPKDELEAAAVSVGEMREDLPKLVQMARMRLNLTQDDLGKKINERKSVISELETGRIHPDSKLLRKLERALSIKLTGATEEE
ncbi:MAG TPA: helix-turn-helix domain-containing protein [Thermoplasmata archaeon]|nr:helix-turn-helix domain-containing protein [Thermoplasmata archaeon]